MKSRMIVLVIVASIGISACSSIGPKVIPRDRFDYNAAISDSWKEQTLLNIVKLRYADMPLFVEVASVVSGYSLESSVNLGATRSSAGAVQGNSGTFGGNATFTDRPTITYAPITGSQFNKSFMTPIPPRSILFLLASGWSADMVFPLAVDSINGQRSEIAAGKSQRGGDDEYYRVVDLLRQVQMEGATSMQIQQDEDSTDAALLLIHKKALSDEGFAAHRELTNLLGMAENWQTATVRYGFLPESDTEIAMITRSMLQIIIFLATQIDVPPAHAADGRTVPTASLEGNARRLVSVQTSEDEPENAFVSVYYRDNWYFIDDRDFATKSLFTFVMVLFSLTESGDNAGLPLVTIPAG